MKNIREKIEKKYGNYPEKILQFGEGNFLRAFADWMIDKANRDGIYKGSILVCQPIAAGMKDKINEQDGIYTLVMRGLEKSESDSSISEKVERAEVITSVSRCINPYEEYEALMGAARSPDLEVVISNTTEAGIAYASDVHLTDTPPASFPGKVTAFLYERYKTFNGDPAKGLLFLPVELIDNNGTELKKLILRYAKEWNLEPGFAQWVETANEITNTLVDRIVTGYPRDDIPYYQEKLGYEDNLIVTSELFNLWVIEGKKEWADKLPIQKTDAHVIWTDDVTPYKKRKVRILNGAHTSAVLAAFLSGYDTVLEFMHDDIFRDFLHRVIFEEIIPTLDFPEEDLKDFANAVADRFANPYIQHKLLDISLNSASKYLARCLPSLIGYQEKYKTLPRRLVFSLAVFIRFYKGTISGGKMTGNRGEGTYEIHDSQDILVFFEDVWKEREPEIIVKKVLGNVNLWDGRDLNGIPGLSDLLVQDLKRLTAEPVRDILSSL